jgi:hypothetical protein
MMNRQLTLFSKPWRRLVVMEPAANVLVEAKGMAVGQAVVELVTNLSKP